MKKYTIKKLLLMSMMFGSFFASAQKAEKSVTQKYNQWAYNEVIELSSLIEDRGFSNREVLKELGNSFFFNAKYKEAYRQYNTLFRLYEKDSIESIYLFRYAQTSKNVGDSLTYREYFEAFKKRLGSDSQIAKLNQTGEIDLAKNEGRYSEIANLPLNTEYSDYGAYVLDKQLYFTSNRDTGSFSKHIHTWTGNQFTKLYNVKLANEEMSDVRRVKGISSNKLNESTAVITKDGQTMYFTKNNPSLTKEAREEGYKNKLLKIYKATRNSDGEWGNEEELPFNSDEFNTAHPALSPDENYLYFCSDRPGGYGASDLWRVVILPSGVFGPIENLGEKINTEARETFPFVSEDNILYFATDGRIGYGGLDVYASQIDGTEFSDAQNLGKPVNSSADDFAYYISEGKGFFSSNRDGGKGLDDIYSFVENRPLEFGCDQILAINIWDQKDGTPVSQARVELYDMNNQLVATSVSKANQYVFNYEFVCGETYRIVGAKEQYRKNEIMVKLPEESGETVADIKLEPIPKVNKGGDLFKILKLKPIYFDYDKDNIRPDAAMELAKIVKIMNDYPKMRIDVRSHTDSRGSDAYNQKLSERRAKSTAEWIMANGIDKSRVTYKGYGESQLVNGCSNGVKCTEEQHQENRRSQFIILDI